jgi:polar amino acid transport system substrate-binding protein
VVDRAWKANGHPDTSAIREGDDGYEMRLIYAYDAVPELSWQHAVGMRRSDEPLREASDRAVEAMLADGTFERMYAKYGIEHRPPEPSRG